MKQTFPLLTVYPELDLTPGAFHVGMDEVFLLGSEHSPSTEGMDPAVLYARAVNDIYNHIVRKHGLEMMMWGDRLIDGRKYPQLYHFTTRQ